MYLTSAQHDQLRTLIMGFEIPYRSYIAEVILDTYHDKCSFLQLSLMHSYLIANLY